MKRKAVGAIIQYKDKFLLVHKVKFLDEKIIIDKNKGEWGFSKGGIKKDETDLEKCLERELKEETGSTEYKIIKKLDDKIEYPFAKDLQKSTGLEGQEITMFLVEYIGDCKDLIPEDDEIDKVQFFTKEEVLSILPHNESREFFKRFLSRSGQNQQ